MNELPTFARPGVPMPQMAPQQPAAPQRPAVPLPPRRPPGTGFDWAGATQAPYSPEMQGMMDKPQGAFAQQPAAPMPMPAPAPAPAARPQPAMNSEQIDMGNGDFLDQIGGLLSSLFAQNQAPAGMKWDSMQGWVPDQGGPR